MRVGRILSWGLGWVIASGAGWAQALQFGMTPEEVMEEIGKPRSTMSAGGRDIWMYDAGGRVTFSAGKVSGIAHLPVDGVDGAQSRAAVTERQQAVEEQAAAEAAAQREEEAAAAREQAELEAAWAEERKKFEAQTEAYLNGEFEGEAALNPELSFGQELLYLGVQMFIGMSLMIVILKGAFAWSDIHGDWSQMILPAFAAAAVRAVVEFAANQIWDVTNVFYVDHGLSYLVLMVTLMKFTHASSWQRAVAVAGAAKLGSIVIWSLLSVVLLNVMFG